MKFFLILMMSILIISCSTKNIKKSSINPHYQVEIVEAVGTSAILEGNIESARKSALSDALRNALHLTVGIYVSANSLVSKSILIDEEIKADTQGYIEKYDILKEYEEKGLYYVKIRAAVRKEDIAKKVQSFENEVEKIGSPIIAVKLQDKTQPTFSGAENALISELKKELFRMSYSTSDVDIIVEGNINTSFNTSEGIGGFISYRCYIEGRIYTSYGEPVGGFVESSAGAGINDIDARNNASVACARKIFPIIKDSVISFYSSKRTIKVEIENVNSLNELNDIIKFFKNIPLVRNVYVKSYDNSKTVIDVVLHKGKPDDIYLSISKSPVFNVKKVSQFVIVAEKK